MSPTPEVLVRPYRKGDNVEQIIKIFNESFYRIAHTEGLPHALKQTYIQVILFFLALVTYAATGSYILGLFSILIGIAIRTCYKSIAYVIYTKFCCDDFHDIAGVYQQPYARSNFFVAEINGRIVGCAAIVNEDSLHERFEEYSIHRNVSTGKLDSDVDNDVKIAELKRMAVDVSFRGLSIGRKLLDHCVKFCKQNNYNRIHLTTTGEQIAAQRLYTRYGFKVDFIESDIFMHLFHVYVYHMSLFIQ
ncbi:N-acetylaspartate synthetase-like [Tubulanus polymorphus]|uniref:N-acetylaspartate synthetase-like n=1 Tax=Tubulanus polymorphus TaxID=672921 RepID=UPI003DA5B0B2